MALLIAGGYYGDWMTDIIRNLHGHHEPQEEVVFHEIVEQLAVDTPRPTMLESVHVLVVLLVVDGATCARDTRSILVEPDPNNLQVGEANFALNHRHAETLQAAVGSEARPPHPFVCESDGQSRLVPTESLASLLTRFEVSHLDLLLLDVQGAELALLEGAQKSLPIGVRFLNDLDPPSGDHG